MSNMSYCIIENSFYDIVSLTKHLINIDIDSLSSSEMKYLKKLFDASENLAAVLEEVKEILRDVDK